MRYFKKAKVLCLTSMCLWALCLSGYSRSWTSTSGTRLEAELRSFKGREVVLQAASGKVITLRFSQLSKEDQVYLRGLEGDEGDQKESEGWTNWEEAYPNTVKTSQNDFGIEELTSEEGAYVYESPHFLFHSDVQLTRSLVKKFAWYFESTHAYLASLPLSLARTQEKKKHPIQLFEHIEDYYRSGGPEESAGVYMPRKDLVLVPLQSVGVKQVGSRYSVDYDGSNRTLSHEIVHSFTDHSYYSRGSSGWFTEGLAEYVALTPYRSGIYMPNKTASYLKQYVTSFSKDTNRGRNLGDKIHVGSLQTYMNLEYEEFLEGANFTYGVGALLVTYFLDLERESELENVQSFLKALKEGKKGEDAINVLLNGRTYEELGEAISKAWRGKGVRLMFD